MGNVIGIVSGKGGVGKTTITANLAACLVKYFGKKVLVVDGNITTPNLGLYFGMLSPENSLIDVLEDKININEAIYIHPSGVNILPSPLSVLTEYPDTRKLREKINMIKNFYDYILIDGAAGIGSEVVSTIKASDYLIIVVNPENTSIVSALKVKKVASILNVPVIGIIVNKTRKGKTDISLSYIEEVLESKIISKIPFSNHILDSINKLKPAVLLYPKSDIIKIFNKIAAQIIGEYYFEKESIFDKLKKIFSFLWRK